MNDNKQHNQLNEAFALAHEKIDATHQMLSQLETQMLHQITN